MDLVHDCVRTRDLCLSIRISPTQRPKGLFLQDLSVPQLTIPAEILVKWIQHCVKVDRKCVHACG